MAKLLTMIRFLSSSSILYYSKSFYTAAFLIPAYNKKTAGSAFINKHRVLNNQNYYDVSMMKRYITIMSTSNNDNDNVVSTLTMDNIYTEWTIDDDKILYQNFNEPLHKVASILGRGLNGVAARKKKLNNVNSSAYQRLFVNGKENQGERSNESGSSSKDESKLVPVIEVLRRIKWDNELNSDDFTVQYFDRVDEIIYECSFDQKNDSVKGKEEMFVFAIPEHRISSIKFKDRTVWDKESRLDCVFGSMNGNGETIYNVIESYDQWKKEEEERKEFNKRRQRELANQIHLMLGDTLFSSLKQISQNIQERASTSNVGDQDVINYVNAALVLFRRADNDESDGSSKSFDEIEALNTFSDLVALLPDINLRERVLLHIQQLISKLELERKPKNNQIQPLPQLNEDELTESFVRGSGAGGQKINKTANKVVLVHEPTQIRVECQDTRSLQQNRKIARKRLQLKLDQHINGVSSQTDMKAAKIIGKKAKSKARNKARQRKKREAAFKEEYDE